MSTNAAIDALIADPGDDPLMAARAAWVAARVPYQQTEVYRFGNPMVDAWEGKVNAWPLDEGLIDYVAADFGTESDFNRLYTVNVVANEKIVVNGEPVDASVIDASLLTGTLHEAEEVEANVATGYHAIEFLLWGQDLNGTGLGAGQRPATDFDPDDCTHGNCGRRAEYLKTASQLLLSDLSEIVAASGEHGAARAFIMEDERRGLSAILTGMGSLSYGELAGENTKLGLLLKDPEEEHDCFADNTNNSHYYNAISIRNVYTGHYRRVDGIIVEGPALEDIVAVRAPALNAEMLEGLDGSVMAMAALKARAESIEARC